MTTATAAATMRAPTTPTTSEDGTGTAAAVCILYWIYNLIVYRIRYVYAWLHLLGVLYMCARCDILSTRASFYLYYDHLKILYYHALS